jgi:ligand-binding sensor domain-containing protein
LPVTIRFYFSPMHVRLAPLFRLLCAGLLLAFSLGGSSQLQARPRPSYALAGHEKPVALLHAGKATLVVTEHSVWQLEGSKFIRKYQSESPVQCAAAADTIVWLGTRRGVVALGIRRFAPRPLPLPGPIAEANITALFRDAQGALWVGANGQGVFRQAADGALLPELRTPSINGGVATADSSVWIATNIGLSRRRGPEWMRYNEEGVANNEIPDNIVEKLLPDNAGNLWVIMSGGICVFEGLGKRAAAEAELPTVRYLGQPGNEVFAVAYLRGEGRLFATAMGLLLLPTEPATSFAPATDRVETKQLLRSVPNPTGTTSPTLLHLDAQQRLWLVSEEAVVVLTAREFHQLAHSPTTASR